MNATLRIALALSATAVLAGCNALVAQNPSSPMQPVNAVHRGDEIHLAVRGYDVVAYVTQGRAVPGSPNWRSQFEGVSYYFASAEHQALFEREPARYQPAYHGYDATRMVYAIPELADRYWKDEVAGSNSLWQGIWRRADRVPHYRSRDELSRAVAQAQGKPG